jgi:hypothetical protein
VPLCLRPPLSLERLTRIEDGRLRYRMKRTFSDGTRELLLTPLELLRRLCALIPPPRVHVTRPMACWPPVRATAGGSPANLARAGHGGTPITPARPELAASSTKVRNGLA